MNQDNKILETINQENFVFQNSPVQRAINEIAEHLVKNNNRSLKEEYELVVNRKSGLSRRLRDLVIMLVETEKVVEEEMKSKEDAKDEEDTNKAV